MRAPNGCQDHLGFPNEQCIMELKHSIINRIRTSSKDILLSYACVCMYMSNICQYRFACMYTNMINFTHVDSINVRRLISFCNQFRFS